MNIENELMKQTNQLTLAMIAGKSNYDDSIFDIQQQIKILKEMKATNQRLNEAKQRSYEVHTAAVWDDNVNDFTPVSEQLCNFYDADVEALSKQLEWLDYAYRKNQLKQKLPELEIIKLNGSEQAEMRALNALKGCSYEKKSILEKAYLAAQSARKNLLEKLEQMIC